MLYDLAVLGGGAGGRHLALRAARYGARVALIERQDPASTPMAATAANKALIRAAGLHHQINRASALGLRASAQVDFPAVMAYARGIGAELAARHSDEQLAAAGVAVYRGTGSFEAYDTALVDGETRVEAARFAIATGSRAAVPAVPGLDAAGCLDDRSFWGLSEQPDSLVVLGCGPLGLEIAQAMARLGTRVTIVADSEQILPREDPEIAARLGEILIDEGLSIVTGAEVLDVAVRDGQKVMRYRDRRSGESGEARGAALLVCAGRLANIEGLNLEAVGIHADPQHGIEVDEFLQTSTRHIFALGDVTGRHPWAHAARREADVVFENAVLRLARKLDDSPIARITYTDPPAAAVGLSEAEALRAEPEAQVLRVEFADLDRAVIDGRTEGLAKLVVAPSGRVLGATILGVNAASALQPLAIALARGLNVADLAEVVPPYPTYLDAAQRLAAQFADWRRDQGFFGSALRWFLGYRDRDDNGAAPSPDTSHAHPAADAHEAHGH